MTPLVAALLVVAKSPPALDNTLTPAEKRAGFKLLFDGKSTKGWRGYQEKTVPKCWMATSGTLMCNGSEGGDLSTTAMYGSFELRFEWKISKGGNSGVIYRSRDKREACWQTGPEYQVLDDASYPETLQDGTSAGACYAVYPVTKEASKPAGEWNEARIVIKGKHVDHYLNGVKTCSYDFGSADFRKRVAASKFAEYPDFGTYKTGYIVLQNHGNEVEYRDIRIRKL